MNYPEPFQQLESLLVAAIPDALHSLKIDEPICAVRIYYYDTHAPSTYFTIKTITEALRSEVIAEEGATALETLWHPGEECGDGEVEIDDKKDALRVSLKAVYALLCEENGEQTYMPALREMVQRVSRTLGASDWSAIFPVTDDFVVVAADGSIHFDDPYHDIVNCVSKVKSEILRERGFLGLGTSSDRSGKNELTDEYVMAVMRSFNDAVETMPTASRVQYWTTQLDKILAGQPIADERLDFGVDFVFQESAPLGEDFVVAVLKLARKWCSQPEWSWPNGFVGDPNSTLVGEHLWEVFSEIGELDHSTSQIESLLRECLGVACYVNKAKPLWGMVPAHCANCLASLFDKYPEAIVDDDTNELTNASEFFPIPLS